MLEKEDITRINPFVRLVQKMDNWTSQNWFVPWRILYDYEIVFVVEGSFKVITSQGSINFKAGDLFIIPPFLRHKQEIPEGENCSYYAVHLDLFTLESRQDFSVEDVYSLPCDNHDEESIVLPELVDRKVYEPEGIDLSVIVQVKNPPVFLKIFKDLYKAFSEKSITSNLHMRAYATLLVATIFDEILKQDVQDYAEKAVAAFAEYISKNFQERIDFSTLINQYAFSPNYFRTLFKQYLKCAPNEYLTQVRIDEAKKLLQMGYSIIEVAEMVGYDEAYFSRVFKKKEGMSPSEWKDLNHIQ